VSGLGAKTFELSAGFLRIPGGEDPLDASGVHPEAYPVVRRILQALKSDIRVLIGNRTALKGLRLQEFTDETFGLPTVTDIVAELEKPGRDPRPEFRTAAFKEGVETIDQLRPGMVLEGVVTNVAAFGAFVDVGVHQDGLVHVSVMADTFVKDPRSVVKPGDIVKVKVVEVDKARKRIALSMRMGEDGERRAGPRDGGRPAAGSGSGKAAGAKTAGGQKPAAARPAGPQGGPAKPAPDGALAEALRRAAEAKGGSGRGGRK
jgi:uncharacterized protein